MKTKRHTKILELISDNAITTQEELLKALANAGFDVTQATISRDIKELKLVKALDENGSYRYISGVKDKKTEYMRSFTTIFSEAIVSIDYSDNIVCVKCLNGMANAACAAFDSKNWNGVVGSLAGDDTIFVLTRSAETSQQLVKDIKRLMKSN